MKIGLWLINVGPWADPRNAATLASRAEELGFESLWTGDHVLFPNRYTSRYPYQPDGVAPIPGGTPIAEPLTHLSWLAGATTTIGLATGVMVVPLRNPVLIAKQLATLDNLSGGRITLGAGIGWLREEFDALGIPFGERAARLGEAVDVARRLWSGEHVSYSGRFTQLDAVSIAPRPVRDGHIPVVIGGTSAAAVNRAGRIATAGCPWRWNSPTSHPSSSNSTRPQKRSAEIRSESRSPTAFRQAPKRTRGFSRIETISYASKNSAWNASS